MFRAIKCCFSWYIPKYTFRILYNKLVHDYNGKFFTVEESGESVHGRCSPPHTSSPCSAPYKRRDTLHIRSPCPWVSQWKALAGESQWKCKASLPAGWWAGICFSLSNSFCWLSPSCTSLGVGVATVTSFITWLSPGCFPAPMGFFALALANRLFLTLVSTS